MQLFINLEEDLLLTAQLMQEQIVLFWQHINLVDIFPTAVSAIDLSYDSGDTIEEFTVEFQVQSFCTHQWNHGSKRLINR
jgi:hypothetical protein